MGFTVNFSQIEFIFLLLVVFLFHGLIRNQTARRRFLLLVSYYFYGYWDWRFLGLLTLTITVDFLVARAIDAEENQQKRKRLLWISLGINLGVLGFFKYFNFFVDSASDILAPFGIQIRTLNVILPVGISFFTFQSLSYTIDVYRRQLKPTRHYLDYALFVSFFPQLVAGPIVRASEFLPQLQHPSSLSWTRAFEGFRQFVFGFFKKVFIADRMAPYIDYCFENAGLMSGTTMWLAVSAYAFQIYCDFSGYSDMAIGCARALGYDFSRNFNLPYLARNITDFWRRWHISLSSWLRDYLYIPLGGNRKGRRRTYINLMLTMLLGGLWHGASWSFVLWGALHGVALASHKFWMEYSRPQRSFSLPMTVLNWAATMLVVWVAWVFFRANDFAKSVMILRKMFTMEAGVQWAHPFTLFALGLLVLQHGAACLGWNAEKTLRGDRWFTPVILFLMLGFAIIFYPKEFTPFVYFQF